MTSLLLTPIEHHLDDSFHFETALRLLPFATQTRVIRKKFHEDAKIALVSSLLQRYILTLITGQKDIQFHTGPFGKPSLEGVQFSMSNEKQVCGMVVGDNSANEFGLDLSRTRDELVKDYKLVLHPLEFEYMDQSHTSSEWSPKSPFQWVWAMKEAYGKYTGLGINYNLQSVRFELPLKRVTDNTNSTTSSNNNSFNSAVFTKKQAHWFTTNIHINETPQPELNVWLTECDGIVCCVIGAHLFSIPQLYHVDVEKMIEEITAEDTHKQTP